LASGLIAASATSRRDAGPRLDPPPVAEPRRARCGRRRLVGEVLPAGEVLPELALGRGAVAVATCRDACRRARAPSRRGRGSYDPGREAAAHLDTCARMGRGGALDTRGARRARTCGGQCARQRRRRRPCARRARSRRRCAAERPGPGAPGHRRSGEPDVGRRVPCWPPTAVGRRRTRREKHTEREAASEAFKALERPGQLGGLRA
jgi:hypothetical protein